jgi:hypothetical protein
MKKILLTVTAVLILFTGHAFAFVFGNDLCKVYSECPPKIVNNGNDTGMCVLIIEGAGYFLSSQSDLLSFLNRVEMAGLSTPDYAELQDILNRAVKNMEKAVETYKTLAATAALTPYNPQVIFQLMQFDYTGYEKTNTLNFEIFNRVKTHLSKGDVTGVILLMKRNIESILDQLYGIKSQVDKSEFPGLPLLWRVNQSYCQTMLSGQYVAEVFNNL